MNEALHSVSNHFSGKSLLDSEKLTEAKEKLINSGIPVVCSVTKKLFEENISNLEKVSLSKSLMILTKDTSLVNLIPKKYLSSFEKLINLIESEELVVENGHLWQAVEEFQRSTRFFFPELGDWLLITISLCKGSAPKTYIKDFMKYLLTLRKAISDDDIPSEPPRLIRKYNPPRDGRAYYFHDGDQIREPRKFTIDKNAIGNYDDKPDDSVCSKIYPSVKGISYLFLWFCPAHGHCYGYHIIPHSEGRKDAAASLYSFIKKPPSEIFYDFACSLEEYTRNRESGFFSETRFFHDIFHGYGHKCSGVFKSNRLLGFNGLNTSICEQFNSFLQCIKTSAKLMTQEHFTFYVQFFIYQWNQARKESFTKRAAIAVACSN